jgi:DNA repair protein RadC
MNTCTVKSEDSKQYLLEGFYHNAEDSVIAQALTILHKRMVTTEVDIQNSKDAHNYLRLKLGEREQEVFAVMFLNSQHQLLSYEEMFLGTIDASAIYPREIVKRALLCNAAAVVLAHNHPSGSTTPSSADKNITRKLSDALALVDVRVLDHIIVGGASTCSFAEQGLL